MARTQNYCQGCGKVIPSGLLKCLTCSLNLMTKGNKAKWRCRVCGARIEAQDAVCDVCGTNFGQEDEKGTSDGVEVSVKAGVEFEEEYVCMICNHPVERKARKCEFCGTVFYDKGEPKYGPVVEKVDRKKAYVRATPNAG